jgi:hypothetical protein
MQLVSLNILITELLSYRVLIIKKKYQKMQGKNYLAYDQTEFE